MQLPGHVGVALVLYGPVAALALRRGRHRRAWLGLLGVLALSMAPDVDLYVAGLLHRGVTHTVWAVLVGAAAVALVAVVVDPPGVDGGLDRARFGAIVGGSAVASHLLGDVLTPMGIRPFLPFSGTTYTLSLVYAADQRANLALLVLGTIVFLLAIGRAVDAGEVASSTSSIETDGGCERGDVGKTA